MTDAQALLGAEALRAAMSRFVTGVTVATYATPHGPDGMTVNSFTSISADPPLVLVSVARSSSRHDDIVGRPFCVNVLGAEQLRVAMAFARRREPGERGAPHDPGWADADDTAPRLASPLAWLRCAPWRTDPGGDHTLVLGLVTDLGYREGDALTYGWSRFGHVTEAAEGIEYLF